ncbi:MAG: OmpA family protein [Arenimonas sp.]
MKLLPTKAFLFLLLALSPAFAGAVDDVDLPDGTDIKGAADHPQIQRFAGSSIRFYQKKAFDEMQVALGPVLDDKPKIATVEGVHTTLVYVMPQDVSTLEAVRAYQAELSKIGEVKLLFSGVNGGGRKELDNGVNEFMSRVYGDVSGASRWMSWNPEYRYALFRIKVEGGNFFMSIYAGMNADVSGADHWTIKTGRVGVRLDIIEPKPMASRMVTVTSADMSAELKKDGSVSLYGILFDTNKADLKPESDAALVEIAKLMAADASLKLLVVGHTDSVGAFEANRDLSQRRAKAVVAALVSQHQVAAARLQSFGASFAAPVASNAAEPGRAKNRRVELVAY